MILGAIFLDEVCSNYLLFLSFLTSLIALSFFYLKWQGRYPIVHFSISAKRALKTKAALAEFKVTQTTMYSFILFLISKIFYKNSKPTGIS